MEINEPDGLKQLFNNLKTYAEMRIRLAKLKAVNILTIGVSKLVLSLVMVIIVLLFAAFTGIATALFLGEHYNSLSLGFLIVSGLYLLMGILLALFGKALIRSLIVNKLIKELLESKKV